MLKNDPRRKDCEPYFKLAWCVGVIENVSYCFATLLIVSAICPLVEMAAKTVRMFSWSSYSSIGAAVSLILFQVAFSRVAYRLIRNRLIEIIANHAVEITAPVNDDPE